jgi:hypothetical protein
MCSDRFWKRSTSDRSEEGRRRRRRRRKKSHMILHINELGLKIIMRRDSVTSHETQPAWRRSSALHLPPPFFETFPCLFLFYFPRLLCSASPGMTILNDMAQRESGPYPGLGREQVRLQPEFFWALSLLTAQHSHSPVSLHRTRQTMAVHRWSRSTHRSQAATAQFGRRIQHIRRTSRKCRAHGVGCGGSLGSLRSSASQSSSASLSVCLWASTRTTTTAAATTRLRLRLAVELRAQSSPTPTIPPSSKRTLTCTSLSGELWVLLFSAVSLVPPTRVFVCASLA